MPKEGYILAVDEGTTEEYSTFNQSTGTGSRRAYRELHQFFRNRGWVEHDPTEILKLYRHFTGNRGRIQDNV